MGVLFALVGIYQRAARHVFWNPKVIVGNAYQSFFRVNSLFWDPSVYGRFLVIVILAQRLVVLASRDRRAQWTAIAVMALSFAGLFFSFSQSSFARALAACSSRSASRWRPRPAAVAAAVALLVLAVAGGRPAPSTASKRSPRRLVRRGAAARSLVKGGTDRARPSARRRRVGGFKRSLRRAARAARASEPKKAASHTTPVTVAAETGVPGFLLFAWLRGRRFVLVFRRASLSASRAARSRSGCVARDRRAQPRLQRVLRGPA